MRLTAEKLKQIIKEELQKALKNEGLSDPSSGLPTLSSNFKNTYVSIDSFPKYGGDYKNEINKQAAGKTKIYNYNAGVFVIVDANGNISTLDIGNQSEYQTFKDELSKNNFEIKSNLTVPNISAIAAKGI
jgi:hypothetical protein